VNEERVAAMKWKMFTPEQSNGKLRKAEVLLSKIAKPCSRLQGRRGPSEEMERREGRATQNRG